MQLQMRGNAPPRSCRRCRGAGRARAAPGARLRRAPACSWSTRPAERGGEQAGGAGRRWCVGQHTKNTSGGAPGREAKKRTAAGARAGRRKRPRESAMLMLTQASTRVRGEQSATASAPRVRGGASEASAERGGGRSGSRTVRDRHGNAEGRRPSRREHAVLRPVNGGSRPAHTKPIRVGVLLPAARAPRRATPRPRRRRRGPLPRALSSARRAPCPARTRRPRKRCAGTQPPASCGCGCDGAEATGCGWRCAPCAAATRPRASPAETGCAKATGCESAAEGNRSRACQRRSDWRRKAQRRGSSAAKGRARSAQRSASTTARARASEKSRPQQ